MDKALLARVESQAWFHRYPRGLPLAMLLLGLLMTVLFAYNLEREDEATAEMALQSDAASLARQIDAMSAENLAYLRAGASMFALSNKVGAEDLAQFVDDMSIDYMKRGVLGFGWIRWVEPDSAKDIRDNLLKDMPPIYPALAPPGKTMAVITMLEPRTERNRLALGYDMYSEPVRRAAIDRARQSGRVTASGRVQLVQDVDLAGQYGALVFVPVYEGGPTRGSAPDGRKLIGLIYSPVRMKDFLQAAVINVNGSFSRVAIYDGPAQPANLLAEIGLGGSDAKSIERVVPFADRRWTLVVASRHDEGLTFASMLVLLLGTAISLLLSALAWQTTTRAAADRRVLEWLTSQAAIRTSLTRELNHRVKNTLANVLSIIFLTRRRSTDIDEFADRLTHRIRALSATHDLLATREWKNAPLRDVVISELAPYLNPEDPHVDLDGPDVLLSPNVAMSLGLALHELATNAAKYGALSQPEGKVSINWVCDTGESCKVVWREHGGPPVSPPQRRGFGIELVERIVSNELQSPVRLEFAPEGVHCVLTVPLHVTGEFVLRSPSV